VSRRFAISLVLWFAAFACATHASACATCFGKSDSDLAQGMNMGILVLLGFIGLVLAGVVTFFIFLIRRGTRLAAETAAANPVTSNKL
jgi:hypothetical protein